MKKFTFIALLLIATAIFAVVYSTVSNKKPKTVLIPRKMLMELEVDLLIFRDLPIPPFHLDVKNDTFVPSKEELEHDSLQFLLPLDRLLEFTTPQQRNCAIMMYVADAGLLQAYNRPVDAHREVIALLAQESNTADGFTVSFKRPVDVNDETAREVFRQWFKGRFDQEVKNGTVNMLYERSLALLIENAYIFSQNPDRFLANISNSDAAGFSAKIAILIRSAEMLSSVYPHLVMIAKELAPLKELRASNKVEFIEQIKMLTPQIKKVRNSLLW